jgi:hypothetical protein
MTQPTTETLRTQISLAEADGGVDIADLCHAIAVNRGFYDGNGDRLYWSYRHITHIMGEIVEYQETLDDFVTKDAVVAEELADCAILLLDLAGLHEYGFRLADLKASPYSSRYNDNEGWMIAAAVGRLANQLYKTGTVERRTLKDALSVVAQLGAYYSGDHFTTAVLSKCRRNLSRPRKYGLKEE